MELKDIRNKVNAEIGVDLLPDLAWYLFGKKLPKKLWSTLDDRDGTEHLVEALPSTFQPGMFGVGVTPFPLTLFLADRL